MTRRRVVVGIVLGLMIALLVGISAFLGTQVVAGSTQLVTNETTTGVSESFFQAYDFDIAAFRDRYQIEQIAIPSTFDDHAIPADWIHAAGASADNDTVIMVHGLGGNRYTNYPVAAYFLEQGYNVLSYDQRSSNENMAEKTTFGYWEKYDLLDYIAYIKAQAPQKQLGIWGSSFGGATAGLALGYENTQDQVDFLILDCPVSSMQWMVEETMRHMDTGLPIGYMTWCGNMANRVLLGFSYQDADVSSALRQVTVPTLIINSRVDTITPYFMGKDIYQALPGENKTLWTVEDSAHVDIWLEHRQAYMQRISSLLDQVASAS